jgi:xanthine dehydrogenase accessory factor
MNDTSVLIKGAGEMASGVAFILYSAGFRRLLMLELAEPLSVRRAVCFCEAVYDGRKTVEGISAVRVAGANDAPSVWGRDEIAVCADPDWRAVASINPAVVIDATLAKRNLGTRISEAALVVALGPGFTAGRDAHVVVETQRGHLLGRLLTTGSAAPDTGIPGAIAGVDIDRVLRSPSDGIFETHRCIGDRVRKGDCIGTVAEGRVECAVGGVIRGLIRPGIRVTKGMKLGDVDPRGDIGYVDLVSDKARAIGGAVLVAVLQRFGVPPAAGRR